MWQRKTIDPPQWPWADLNHVYPLFPEIPKFASEEIRRAYPIFRLMTDLRLYSPNFMAELFAVILSEMSLHLDLWVCRKVAKFASVI